MTARRPQISKPALRRLAHPAAALEARGLVRYVAVHHKAGIVWMNRFFRTLGWRIGVPVIKLGQAPVPGRDQTLTADGRRTVPEERVEAAVAMVSGLRRGFAFDHAGAFAEVPYQLERLRGVHVVRDPRDVLISATFYHASNRRETWLQWRELTSVA